MREVLGALGEGRERGRADREGGRLFGGVGFRVRDVVCAAARERVRRRQGETPEYDLRDVDETVVVRVSESEFSG